jgi:glycosyltransferase involved in cell wall biosynthesis
MNYLPKISVIMPVYNSCEVVGSAIDSILGQTFTDFEFIIINDGSSDGSSEILEHYRNKDKRITVISHCRRGLSYSINRGLEIARGEFIVRQDADDISLPYRLERQLKFINDNNLDIVGSYAYLVNEKGGIVGKITRPVSHDEIALRLKKENCILHPTLMFRKETILSLGGYSEQYEFAQDYELYLRGLIKGLKFGCIPEILVKIRHSSSSVSVKRRRRQLLYAISAQAMYFARQQDFKFEYIKYILLHILKIFIPMWVRKLRVWVRNRR